MNLFHYIRFRKLPPDKKPPPESHLDVWWDEEQNVFIYQLPNGEKHPMVDLSDVYLELDGKASVEYVDDAIANIPPPDNNVNGGTFV